MARKISPKWYPQRKCFRIRKTLIGKTYTFYGGYGATGPDDESAYARAVVEIENKLNDFTLGKRSHIVNQIRSKSHTLKKMDRVLLLKKHADDAIDALIANDHNIDITDSPPLMIELEHLREENARLKGQLAVLGRAPAASDASLNEMLVRYKDVREQECRADDMHPDTISEIKKGADRLVDFLEDQDVITTGTLDSAGQIVAEYRDLWLDRITESEVSRSTARKMLLYARQFLEWLYGREYLSRMPPCVGKKWASVGKDEVTPAHLTVDECRLLFAKADERKRLFMALGLNAGYRQGDMRSLKREDIDMTNGVILRQRHKTGKAQAHKLWPVTLDLLKSRLSAVEGDPFKSGWSNASRETTEFMQGIVSQSPQKRTAKSLRSTGANELEKLLESKHPRLVGQYLAHADRAIAKHYRDEDTAGLFEALDRLGHVFGLDARS